MRLASLLLLLGLGGCFPTCPDRAPDVLAQGSFRMDGADVSDFPRAGLSNKAMTIDKAGGRVVISYQREGKKVVEVWRIKTLKVSSY